MAVEKYELRIGNWVSVDSKYIQVEDINDDGINQEISTGYYGSWETDYVGRFYNWHKNESGLIQPIPLTPKLLIACGFEKYYDPQKDHRREWWSIEHFTLEVYDAKVEFVSLTSNQRVFFPYLHQLQNLYFALTNSELIYNLK